MPANDAKPEIQTVTIRMPYRDFKEKIEDLKRELVTSIVGIAHCETCGRQFAMITAQKHHDNLSGLSLIVCPKCFQKVKT